MREIVCDVSSQAGRRVFVRERITMGEIRRISKLEVTARSSWDDVAFGKLYGAYARLVPEWEFQDEEDQPLPQPKDDATAFDLLSPAEFTWLTEAVFSSVSQPPPVTG